LKIDTGNFTFFTTSTKGIYLKIEDNINIYINTSKITFIKFIQGFYTTSFNIRKLKPSKPSVKQYLLNYINNQHQNKNITSLFNALFFALPIDKELRDMCSTFGVSHLIAISGFHLGILSMLIYWLLYFPYSIIQNKYFPYRNKKFDLLVLTSILLFAYLIFVNIVPSLLRAFVMFIVGIYFLRTNIKLISFSTLALIVILITVFVPKLFFSISLWFSVSGVFYIFLFLKYFHNRHKVIVFILFNIWIYLSMNPIIHFFFGTTSLAQLYSPLFTVGFTIFYPVELFLHLVGYGNILDYFIEKWLDLEIISYHVSTPIFILIGYIVVSFLSIIYKQAFILLNIFLLSFNIWLYMHQ